MRASSLGWSGKCLSWFALIKSAPATGFGDIGSVSCKPRWTLRHSSPTAFYRKIFATNGGSLSEVETKNSMLQAKFVATKDITTDPVSVPNEPRFLQDFFMIKDHRDLLFPYEFSLVDSGDPSDEDASRVSTLGKHQLPSLPESSTLVDTNVLEFVSAGLNFPGIKVTSIMKMSSQLFLSGAEKMPEYRFILLESTTKAEGPRPLVWLFNKLTKAENNQEQSTFSYTRISGEIRGGKLVFHANARLEVRINIPRVMLKLLPVKLETFEEQGSKSLEGAMKDLERSINRFKDAYIQWISL